MDISSFTEAFSDITLQTPTLGVVISIFLVVFLLLLSGFASASEISFFSLSPADIADLDVEHSARDRKIEMLRQDSERTLATILITNNFVNVTVIMLCNFIFGSLIHFGPRAEWLEFLVLTVLLTFLLLLFGEIMPKVYSRQNPLIFCRFAVNGILFFRKFFWLLETILTKSGVIAEKVWQKKNRQLSVDDLEQALELTDKEDIKDEQSMLQGIIRFGDETAKEVMTTRQDIVNLDIHSNFTEVLQCIVENNYSRIPVYQDNTDHIRGILYIKVGNFPLAEPHSPTLFCARNEENRRFAARIPRKQNPHRHRRRRVWRHQWAHHFGRYFRRNCRRNQRRIRRRRQKLHQD